MSSYLFRDVLASEPVASDLPAEAMSFNGTILENAIPGYRTLSVSGREGIPIEVTDREKGLTDGNRYVRRRYTPRTITVQYQLIADTPRAFRSAYNQLNYILSDEQAQIIFQDEPDKYFTGTVNEFSEVPEGRNSVTASFSIYCTDPFKYSVEEYEVEFDENGEATIDYDGTAPSFPVFEVDCKSDVGCIVIYNQDGKVIQLGPGEQLATEGASSGKITAAEWGAGAVAVPAGWVMNQATLAPGQSSAVGWKQDSQARIATGSRVLTGYPGNKYTWTDRSVRDSVSHNTSASDDIHGTGLSYTLDDPIQNFEFAFRTLFFSDPSLKGKDTGYQEINMIGKDSDGNNFVMAGLNWFKGLGSSAAVVDFIVNGEILDSWTYNCVFANAYTGGFYYSKKYGQRGGEYKQAGHGRIIKKSNGTIRFQIGRYVKDFYASDLIDQKLTGISLYTGCNAKISYPLAENGFTTVWLANTTNTFKGVCDVVIYTNSGEITVDDMVTYGVGRLGNDYEDFYLKPCQQNKFHLQYSTWTTQAPTSKIKYRKAFL